MNFTINSVYERAIFAKTRYVILLGGRAAGRSTVASQNAIIRLFQPEYFRAAIMRNVFGDIRDSIFKEVQDRIDELREQAENPIDEAVEAGNITLEAGELLKKKLPINQIKVNSSVKSFQNPFNKNLIIGKGFKKASSQQTAKLKSLANFTHVFIEEADENSEEDFNQLDDSIRKVGSQIQVWLMLNPPSKNHWIIKRWFNLIDSGADGFYIPQLKKEFENQVTFIHSNYESNLKNLNQTSIQRYEEYLDNNPDHYYTMIKGLVSEGSVGRIFKNWQPITAKEYFDLPYDEILGLDFGFVNDETALVGTKKHNNKLYVHEYIYQKGLTNNDIHKEIVNLGLENTKIIADCAEPKSVEELNRLGLDVEPAVKGADSVVAGIDKLKSLEISYTETSTNLAFEIQEYRWALDKNKEPINKPIDKHNHLLDSIRYSQKEVMHISFPELPDFSKISLKV